MQVKLSAVIITFNEEKNITRCIESLKGVADEIVVVDSFSTDKTEEICKQHNVRFLQHEFAGYASQKNVALKAASFDHILSLDADEALSDELRESIIAVKSNWQADGYYFSRLTNYCGKWIRHGGWYPDRKLRLVDRRKAKWGGGEVHEKIIMDSGATTRLLNGDLLHYSIADIAQHIDTVNRYSSMAANEAVKNGKQANLLIHVILNPWFTFIRKYFLQSGFLDGYYGLVIAVISAYSNFLKYAKIRELNRHAHPSQPHGQSR